MPRVVAVFNVDGWIHAHCAQREQLRIQLTVLNDGSLLGAVAQQPQWLVENGKASIDHVESTPATPVYTCRFTLIHCDGVDAQRMEVVGRLSQAKGLMGRWHFQCTGSDGDNDDVVIETPLHLPVVVQHQVAHRPVAPVAPEAPEAINPTAAAGIPPPQAPQQWIFRGDQVDAFGKKYPTTMFVAVLNGSRIKGIAHDVGRQCPVNGTLHGSRVCFRLAYPHSKTKIYYYDYTGKLETNAFKGTTRLVGTWAMDTNASPRGDAELLEGTFDFLREEGCPAANTRSQGRLKVP